MCYNYIYVTNIIKKSGGSDKMKHIKTINKPDVKKNDQKNGCGKNTQDSGPSACKISCTVANHRGEN